MDENEGLRLVLQTLPSGIDGSNSQEKDYHTHGNKQATMGLVENPLVDSNRLRV